ncbi:hypothetical protein QCN29_26965 [Streptomyces sp. HNM0663]|uniref:DNA-damage-inducible protein D n=1 Tax=Streptomyces chengmaiensis TaxID=3040919 RepID=A0ABT6HUG2_9ACTN|nr:hypothetical protein [Streptomyces chengmaiensis]MDH2392354.1 hypothetical protein [Streptomyces chengmaiensis]
MHQKTTSSALPSTPTEQRDPTAPESPFDAIRRVRPDGSEYWPARDMQPLMGYSQWSKLKTPLTRAMATAKNQGLDVAANFPRSGKVAGQSGPAPEDYELSRTAAYLLAMNGDPNKPEVAAAQLYFAAKTREAELAAQETVRPKSGAELVLQMAQELVAQEQRLATIEATQAATAAKVAALEGRHDEFTALGYAKLHDHPTGRPYLAQVGRRATRIMREQGREPHQRQDATFGVVNVYPVLVLEHAFSEVTR